LLLLASDGTEDVQTEALGQPFELAVGGSVTIAETGLQLTLRGVAEDSRCPPDVNCFWAGRVVTDVEAWAPGDVAEAFVLATCCPAPEAGRHSYAGQTIELVGLRPAPAAAGQSIPIEDYRADLLVSAD
jgi:hypothetical protein